MSRYDHISQFGEKPVVLYERGMSLSPGSTNYRIAWSWNDETEFAELFTEFLSSDGADRVTGLITGAYCEEMYDEDMSGVVESLVSAATQLPKLTDLFVGDIISEENEISWIQQTDLSPLWTAFPRLQSFGARGGQNLSLGTIIHDQLRSLTIETGGLGRDVIAQIASAKLPELRHLEIWTGDPGYGADSTIEDLRPFFDGSLFPKLNSLGICNCDYVGDVIPLIADSPVLPSITVLDLSMGSMSDEAIETLLRHREKFANLKTLNLSENMLSSAGAARLAEMPCPVNTDGQREGWKDSNGNVRRYPAVGE